ncbi:hypothetical protein I553_4003 [Mycobacterium xenopi 4042]|uniref:Uncharacterized protein n=1 Tax=Mycobacterium xenopi 4042 TaxID=1299334 RepID=X8AJD7_MYCXE|nr:hypothetical protein I553_4003 [Mycobacterium xenopi 4042]
MISVASSVSAGVGAPNDNRRRRLSAQRRPPPGWRGEDHRAQEQTRST